MPPQREKCREVLRLWVWALMGAVLSACNDDESAGFVASTTSGVATTPRNYTMRALVSDGSVRAETLDGNLIAPWGIVFAPGEPVWVVNNATNTATRYTGAGAVGLSQPVSLPGGINGAAAPTGAVFNGTGDFVVTNGATSAPATFIVDGEGGTLLAWAAAVNPASAVIVHDDGNGRAVYTGLAIAANQGANRLYAADFGNGKIDVFNGGFQKIASGTVFLDPSLPAGYAPFGIRAMPNGGTTVIFVTYAQRTPGSNSPVTGAGLGFVNIFDTNGTLISHFVPPGGRLDAPWGVAMAPDGFGPLRNTVLIGNVGDGVINAYDPASGAFIDSVRSSGGQPIATPGLRGIAFGNGAQDQPANALFFAASIANGAGGLYGRITPAESSDSGASSDVRSDTIPPTVSLTMPGPNAIATDIITILATATDNVGVVSVEFFAGSALIGVATGRPFFVDWDTRTVGNGSITLVARAKDAAGNSGASVPITINVSNVPRAPPR